MPSTKPVSIYLAPEDHQRLRALQRQFVCLPVSKGLTAALRASIAGLIENPAEVKRLLSNRGGERLRLVDEDEPVA